MSVTPDPPAAGRDNGADVEGCEKNHCHGRRRDASGKACHRPAGWGTDHLGTGRCKLHGGSTPTHRAAARAEIARQAVVTYGLPREVDPSQALLEEVHRTAGHVAWLGARVAELEADVLTWGVAEEIDRPLGAEGGGGLETKRKAAPHALVVLYQQERKHLAQVSKAAIDAGVAERVVTMFEQVGSAYVQVLERVLDGLELTAAQRARVPGAVERVLRPIAGGVG